MRPTKYTAQAIRAMKARGEKVAALTAYDFPTARLLDEVGIPFILVGDSLGMVVLGFPDTTHVTMADMEHHVRAVTRAKPHSLVVADMPFEVTRRYPRPSRMPGAWLPPGQKPSRPRAGARFSSKFAGWWRKGCHFAGIWACCRSTSLRRAATG